MLCAINISCVIVINFSSVIVINISFVIVTMHVSNPYPSTVVRIKPLYYIVNRAVLSKYGFSMPTCKFFLKSKNKYELNTV